MRRYTVFSKLVVVKPTESHVESIVCIPTKTITSKDNSVDCGIYLYRIKLNQTISGHSWFSGSIRTHVGWVSGWEYNLPSYRLH